MRSNNSVKVLLTTTAIVAASVAFAPEASALNITGTNSGGFATTGNAGGLAAVGPVSADANNEDTILMNSATDSEQVLTTDGQTIDIGTALGNGEVVLISDDSAVINVNNASGLIDQDGGSTGDAINSSAGAFDVDINVTAGGITVSNSGTGDAIDLSLSTAASTIDVNTTTGYVSGGDVKLTNQADVVTLTGTGAANSGNAFNVHVDGSAGGSDTLVVNLTSGTDSLTLGDGTNTATDVETITITEGDVVNSGIITGTTTLNLDSADTLFDSNAAITATSTVFSADGALDMLGGNNLTTIITNDNGAAAGNLIFQAGGNTTVSGQIGAAGVAALNTAVINQTTGQTVEWDGASFITTVDLDSTGELQLDGALTGTTLNIDGAGTVDANAAITVTNTVFSADGTLDILGGNNATTIITNDSGSAAGNLIFTAGGNTTVSGAIGTSTSGEELSTIIVNQAGGEIAEFDGAVYATTVDLDGVGEMQTDSTINATTINLDAAGTFDANGTVTATSTVFSADATLDIAGGSDLTTVITNDNGAAVGTLQSASGGNTTVSGQVGAAGVASLSAITVNQGVGETFTLSSDSFATTVNVSGAGTLDTDGSLSATTLNVTQGKAQFDASSTVATTVLGATAAGEIEVNAGTFTGNVNAAATGFDNIVDLNVGTIDGNVDLSTATAGTNAIDLAANTTVTGTVLTGAGGDTLDVATGATITGAITGGAGGDVFTIDSGATLSGAILGGGGADTFALAGGTTFTAGSTIGTIETITTTGASTNLTTGGAITGVDTSLNIGASSTVTANHGITGTGALTLDGTLNVEGNTDVSFATAAGAAGASSNYVVNIDSATSDDASQIILSGGGIDLSAGTMTVAIDSDVGYIADGTTYMVVDGAGASVVAGTLTASDTSAVYSFTTALDGTDDIDVTVNRASFVSLGTNSSADGAGGTLDALTTTATGDLLTIQNQLGTLDTGTAVSEALETLSPSNAGVGMTNVNVQGGAFNTVSNRLASLRTVGETGIATAADGTKMHAFWMEGFGSAVNQDARKGEDGFDASTFGLTVGADSDSLVQGYNIGGAFSYARSNVDSDLSSNAETDIDSYQLSGYLSTTYQDYFINALASVAKNSYDSKRTVSVGSFTNEAKGDYDGTQVGFRAEVGRDYKMQSTQGVTLSPTVGLDYSHVSIDDYTETGAGGANLTVDSDSIDTVELSAGLTAKYEYMSKSGAKITPELRAKLKYNAGDNKASTSATFAGGGNAFTTDGLEVARAGVSVGTGFTVETKDVDFVFSYDADIKSDYLSHTGVVRARWAF